VADLLPREFAIVRGTNHAVVSLEEGGTLQLAYTVRCAVKGDFVLGPVRARSLDSLGLTAEDASSPVTSRIVVAPAMEDLRRITIRPRRTRPWFGPVPSRRIGEGAEFWGVREYASGDEVRRINWRASARLDRLQTNEYEGERTGDVVVVLDARREAYVGTEADNPVEHGVRAALGIVGRVLAEKNRAGLIVQRRVLDVVRLASGRKQLYRILEHLLHVAPGGEWPIAYVASAVSRHFPPGCLVVLITPLLDRGAFLAVMDLLARGYDVSIVSPSPLDVERRHRMEAEEDGMAYRILAMERANLLAQLRRVAPVVEWDPATSLALALRRMTTRPNPV
jgi:uncharacterized protein (DUF58 family)